MLWRPLSKWKRAPRLPVGNLTVACLPCVCISHYLFDDKIKNRDPSFRSFCYGGLLLVLHHKSVETVRSIYWYQMAEENRWKPDEDDEEVDETVRKI